MIAKEHRFLYASERIAEAATARAYMLQPELDELVARAAALRVGLNQAIELAIEGALCHEVFMDDDGFRRPMAVIQSPDGFAEPRNATAMLHIDREAWDRYSFVDRRRREVLAKMERYQHDAARYRSQTNVMFELDAEDVSYFGLDRE